MEGQREQVKLKDPATLFIVGFRKLWLERNARVFDNNSSSVQAVVNLAVQ